MSYHDKKSLQEFDKGKVIMYKRYVNDIFCIFENVEDTVSLFELLICQQKNIKFTLEKEDDNFLSFLDILIRNEESHFFIISLLKGNIHSFVYPAY